jgi:hypothetical protein
VMWAQNGGGGRRGSRLDLVTAAPVGGSGGEGGNWLGF